MRTSEVERPEVGQLERGQPVVCFREKILEAGQQGLEPERMVVVAEGKF